AFRRWLFGLDVDGAVAAAVVLLKLVADALLACEGAQAAGFDGADMHRGIAAAVVRLDEAEAFFGVEEFHGSGGHFDIPSTGRADDRAPIARSSEREGKRSRKAPMTVNLRLIAQPM